MAVVACRVTCAVADCFSLLFQKSFATLFNSRHDTPGISSELHLEGGSLQSASDSRDRTFMTAINSFALADVWCCSAVEINCFTQVKSGFSHVERRYLLFFNRRGVE